MDDWVMLGLVAGMLTTIGFVPQIIKGLKTKRMDDVSLFMPALLGVGMLFWTFYGIALNNVPIIFWNVISLSLNIVVISLKLKYMHNGSETTA